METKLIKISEAAKILGVSKLTLRNWDKSGKLIAFRHPINNYRVYRSEDIKNIIKQIESGEKIFKPTKKKLSTTKNEISKNIENISEIKISDLKNNNIPIVTNSAMPEFVTNPNISQNNSEMKLNEQNIVVQNIELENVMPKVETKNIDFENYLKIPEKETVIPEIEIKKDENIKVENNNLENKIPQDNEQSKSSNVESPDPQNEFKEDQNNKKEGDGTYTLKVLHL